MTTRSRRRNRTKKPGHRRYERERSRAFAFAAAIHDALGWPIANARDNDVFRDGKFTPNMHCYRTMLRALGGDVTQEELEALWQAAVENADET